MAIICTCRAVSGNKLENFLKDKDGKTVALKDVLNECGSGTGSCCGNSQECMGAIKSIVKIHNDGKPVDQATIKDATDKAAQLTAERVNRQYPSIQPA